MWRADGIGQRVLAFVDTARAEGWLERLTDAAPAWFSPDTPG